MRIEIESECNKDDDVLNYLRNVDGQDRKDLAAKLLNHESAEKLEEAFEDLEKQDLFDLVPMEDMTTLGIRTKLLDSAVKSAEV